MKKMNTPPSMPTLLATLVLRDLISEHSRLERRIQAQEITVVNNIDKIKLKPPKPIPLAAVINVLRSLGVANKKLWMSEGWFEIFLKEGGSSNFQIECKRCGPSLSLINYIQINPSKAPSFQHSVATLFKILGPPALGWPITRIDFACEFSIPYMDLLSCINIEKKYSRVTYKDMKSVTGVYVGINSDEIIVIYDPTSKRRRKKKSIPEAKSEQRGRLEVRLQNEICKNHIPNLEYLLENPEKVVALDIFKHVDLQIPVLKQVKLRIEDRKVLHRLVEFIVINKRFGFYNARKTLDLNNNFKRDYGSLLKLTPFPVDFKARFNADLLAALQADPEESLW